MVKQYTVTLTLNAEADLREIIGYIRDAFSAPDTAREQGRRLLAAIRSLKSFPERHTEVSLEPFGNTGMRRMPVDNYLIFYRVNQQKATVQILHIQYARRDWRGFFAQPGDDADV
jgi:plasmid stabilization system protein ParE